MQDYRPKVGDLVMFGLDPKLKNSEKILEELVFKKSYIKPFIDKMGGNPTKLDIVFEVTDVTSPRGLGYTIKAHTFRGEKIPGCSYPAFSAYQYELSPAFSMPTSSDKLLLAIKKTYGN